MTFVARKNIPVDLRYPMQHQTLSRWYVPSNNRSTPLYWVQCLRSQALVQYCLHPEYCLNVEFHIAYDGDRGDWDPTYERHEETNHRMSRLFFHDWIISRIIALPIVGASRRGKPAKKRHQWKISGSDWGEEQRFLRGKSRLAFFNVETSSSLPAPRDVKRKNRKESHRKKLPRRPQMDIYKNLKWKV